MWKGNCYGWILSPNVSTLQSTFNAHVGPDLPCRPSPSVFAYCKTIEDWRWWRLRKRVWVFWGATHVQWQYSYTHPIVVVTNSLNIKPSTRSVLVLAVAGEVNPVTQMSKCSRFMYIQRSRHSRFLHDFFPQFPGVCLSKSTVLRNSKIRSHCLDTVQHHWLVVHCWTVGESADPEHGILAVK